MGREAETVELIRILCNGAGIYRAHYALIEIRPGQEPPKIPEGLYVCDKCKADYRKRRYEERIRDIAVRHDSDEGLNKLLSDILKGLDN